VAHVVDPAALHQGGRAEPLLRPVVDLSARELVVNRLPEELPGLLVEAHQDALVDGFEFASHVLADVALVAGPLVVRPDEHLTPGDNGPAVGPRPEVLPPQHPLGGPLLHVLLVVPVRALGRELLQLFLRVDHVPVGRTAEHDVVGVPRGRGRLARLAVSLCDSVWGWSGSRLRGGIGVLLRGRPGAPEGEEPDGSCGENGCNDRGPGGEMAGSHGSVFLCVAGAGKTQGNALGYVVAVLQNAMPHSPVVPGRCPG